MSARQMEKVCHNEDERRASVVDGSAALFLHSN
jgi:hypothetical protein